MESPPGLGQGPRVCVVSENMGLVLDEGGRMFARSLVEALGRRGPVLGISVGSDIDAPNTAGVKADRLFSGRALRARVRDFKPDLLCYVPRASDTVFSFLRLRILAGLGYGAVTSLVALQPRAHTAIGRWLQRRLAPDIVFVQSGKRTADLSHIRRPIRRLPSGVDLDRFSPVPPAVQSALRAKYGFPQDAYIVLHVGHLTRERNVSMLEEVQRRWQVVMVSGNSVGVDLSTRQRLEDSGALVLEDYLESVEEVYQAADCFFFPVRSDQGSIEVPLSVLEAMACNLPVVTTAFGGLRDLFPPTVESMQSGLLFGDDPEQLPDLISVAQQIAPVRTRKLVRHLSWDSVASKLIETAEEVAGVRQSS